MRVFAALTLVLILSVSNVLVAQTPDIAALKQKADELVKREAFTDALPILEQLVIAEPSDPGHQYYLGFGLLGQAANTADTASRKALRVRARAAFIKAKELGSKQGILDGLIQGVSPDGSDGPAVSSILAANDAMQTAEALFSQGKLQEALGYYQKALDLDPRLYEAALFAGDVYTQTNDFTQAEIWYQKAIAINPNRETAYRYSATPFMRMRKFEDALPRYIDAYISEPYNNLSVNGLRQWATATNSRLAHPTLNIPVTMKVDSSGKMTATVDARVAGNVENGGPAWVVYGGVRILWQRETFARTFPGEKTYRHSLQEEAEALRAVVKSATENGQVKSLSPEIALLQKLENDGLLEAYIILARPDDGIARDQADYVKKNRDKLRQYVTKYVVIRSGN